MEEEDVEVTPSEAPTTSGTDLTSTKSSDEVAKPTKPASCESIPAIHSYQIKPPLADRFKAEPVKEIIRNVLFEHLRGKTYDADKVKKWNMDIANEISLKVTELKMKRYKHIVQVTIGEHKGAGVKSGVRCFWDTETDGYTSDLFLSETFFCLAVVFAIYLY